MQQEAHLTTGDVDISSSSSSSAGEPARAAHESPSRSHRRLPPLEGAVVFASLDEQSQRSSELLGAGALVITVPPPTKDMRGRFGEVLEELVERELARVGAPSPYLAAWTASPEDAEARLADQLFRARTVGATGLAIAMASLRAIAIPVMTPDDSATLRWLAETTAEAPLVLLVDDSDLHVMGYGPPLSLETLLSRDFDDVTTIDTRVEPIHVVAEAAAPEGAIEVEIDVRVEASEPAPGPVEPTPRPIALAAASAKAGPIVETSPTSAEPEPVIEAAPPPPHRPPPPPTPATLEPAVIVAAPALEEPPAASSSRTRRNAARATVGIPVSGPNDAWRGWAVALTAAKGAQALGAFERLFAESYVPLANAVAGGLDDPRAVRACDEFRRSFERSYTDSFATFGATNRRPRLVMDAYDLASKQARLANARSAHILIVDSMRFDLGCMFRDALSREATGIAMFTAEVLLWSALPTTTIRQLETFARGLDALRAPANEEPSESLRGRAAEVVRRLRVGSRELYKLDLVPAMLDARRHDVVGALPEIAESVAEAVARHIATLAPRTLLFVVGDHGFSVDRRGEVHTGGASPEEVLVPAFSWLVGDLH